jgi:C4-dicarboxylate transporter DctQ subunit
MSKSPLWKAINNFELYFASALLVVLVTCLGMQVFYRYVLGDAPTWSEELSRMCFVWIVYLGASLAAQQQMHVRVTAQYLMIPERYRIYLWVLADLLWIGCNVLFLVQGVAFVQHTMRFVEMTPTLHISKHYIYMVLPVTSTLLILRILQVYYRIYKENGSIRGLVKAGGGH